MGGVRWTYQRAGVNIRKANEFIRRITPLTEKTRIPGVIGSIGGFSGFFDPSKWWSPHSILVASSDGVGTKLEIAQDAHYHESVGIDLVAMCVNDLVTTGARPLFFFDYIACGKLSLRVTEALIRGIARGCRETGCALLGGETAEMPGFHKRGRYDLAGFTVGVVDRRKMIDGRNVKEGDLLVGLASSGFHSNGFSLLRKVFSRNEIRRNWRRFLLPPTRIYVKPLLRILPKVHVKGLAHITGGSFFEKLVRVVPNGLVANVRLGSWPIPDRFEWVQKRGNVSLQEMFRTFNMGIGMVVIVSPGEVRKLSGLLKKDRLKHWIIGRMEKNQKSSKKVLIEDGPL